MDDPKGSPEPMPGLLFVLFLGGNMEFIFAIFPVLFAVMFIFAFGTVIISWIQAMKQWNKNNNSPRLTVDANIVGKRTAFRRGIRNSGVHTGSTSYYAAFQVESGEQIRVKHSSQYVWLVGRRG